MNLQQFDSLCNDCCFSRSLETKQFAEKTIYQFIEDIRNIETLYQILQSTTSGSTIFVISEYISKIVVSERSFKGFSNTEHVPQEMAIISGSCYSGEEIGVLFQKCKIYEMLITLMCTSLQNQLDIHVQNSLCNTVGLLIQQVMMISGNPFEKFKQLFNPFFQGNQFYHLQVGLKLIQNTLQNIQLYSSYESYVSYRRIMFQVQGNDVLDFMATVSLVIKNCQPPLYKQALTTLKDILMFNFNVSYFELESDFDPNDQNNVSFPERLAEYFNDRQLIQLLFQIIVSYAATVDSAVALTSLKCLKRIVSARKRIFTEKTKKRQFAKEMYAGAIYLFEKVQSSTEEVVSDILEFNSKLNANFGLRQIRFDFAFSQQWLYCLQTYCIQILQKQMKIKDPHIVQMVELMKKLVKFTTDFKLDPSFKQSIAKTIGEVGKAIVHLLLNSQNSFFDGYSPQNHKKLKHTLKDFFENLFPVLAIDLASHMRMIYHSFKNAATDQEKFIIELSLINHVVINPLIIEKSNEEIAGMVQTIIKESLIFLSLQNPLPPLVTMSAMSLAENLFQFALSETDESIGRQRSNKTFFDLYIKPIQMAPNYATDQLLKYIFLQLQVDNKEIIEQALIIMKETIVRLKHHLYNDTFQQSAVVTQIKSILLNLKNTALQKEQFFPCRTLAAEILSILLFDSAYENYIESIVQLNQLLTLQPTEQSISIYLYEMLGYFRHVDVSKIFRLLIKQHLFKVTDLTKFILIEHPAQFQLCKLCLKLMVAITENKSLRFQYHSSSIVQIELVRSFQGILTQYIQHLINAIQDSKVKQEYSSSICRLVGLVYKIMNNILKGKYISQACQLLFADRKYLDLLIVVLEITQQIASYMILYNKACLQMIQVLQTISSSQLQLFEIHPQSLTTLLNIVDQIQKHLLTSLSEEYRTQTVATYHQPLDKVNLDQTTEIVISTLEFVSEEQQLAQLNMIQSFILPLEAIIESILKELFLCLIKGQCSQQTNVKITRQIFAIMCTYQQTFIKVLSRIMLRDQTFEGNQLALLTQDLDLRIKQQNEEQFKKNLPLFIQQFGL